MWELCLGLEDTACCSSSGWVEFDSDEAVDMNEMLTLSSLRAGFCALPAVTRRMACRLFWNQTWISRPFMPAPPQLTISRLMRSRSPIDGLSHLRNSRSRIASSAVVVLLRRRIEPVLTGSWLLLPTPGTKTDACSRGLE